MKDYDFEFKEKFPFEKRKLEAGRIREKYHDRIPIIVEKYKDCKTLPDIDKKKFLVPQDLTMGQFQYVVRKRLKNVSADHGLYFFINNTIFPCSEMLSSIYSKNKDKDDFLYIVFTGENTFG